MTDYPQINIEIAPIFSRIFEPHRYKIYYGGRGSGRSHTICRYLLVRSLQEKIRILCCREFQASISDSVHRLLSDLISQLKLDLWFRITHNMIESVNGSQFIFVGLAQNTGNIKSYEGIDECFIEEAERVSENSYDILLPTIRKPSSEIIISFNPQSENDPTFKRFVKNPQPDSIVQLVTYLDNPFFPSVLQKEMEWCKNTDYSKFEHVWLGKCRNYSDAQVFKDKFVVQEFDEPDPEETRFFFGNDFGFSSDPNCAGRVWMKNGYLYIDYEMYAYHMELQDLALALLKIPGIKNGILYCDNSRPESIAFLQRNGFPNARPCDKWRESVLEGIEYLKTFKKIIIHPRCKNIIYDFSNYTYKIDKITNEVLPILVDKDNHGPDMVRYACNEYIKKKTSIYDFGVMS